MTRTVTLAFGDRVTRQSTASGWVATSQDGNGLLWTPSMLTAMRARWTAQTTFWSSGDVGTSSPGDGARIDGNAAAFRSGTTQAWNPGTAPIAKGEADSATEGRNSGYNVRDCAFRYLMAGDTADQTAVHDHLVSEYAQPWMDTSNATWWTQGGNHYLDLNPLFVISELWARYLFAYHCIGGASAFTAQEEADIKSICEAQANFLIAEFNAPGYLNQFTDRDAGTLSGTNGDPTSTRAWASGPFMPLIQFRVNNRRMAMARYCGMVGAIWGNATIIDAAKYMVRDFVRFGINVEGGFGDMDRETATDANLGWAYGMATLSSCLEIALMLYYLQGDSTWIDLSTTVGAGSTSGTISDGTADAGSNKSLLQASKIAAKYVDQNVYVRNGLESGAAITTGDRAQLCFLAIGNSYFNDSYIASVLDRSAPGVGATWPTASTDRYEGNGRVYPGVHFIFDGT